MAVSHIPRSDATIVDRGERPCVYCGKPHDARALPHGAGAAYSWADPGDGHPYRPEPWEAIARRLGFKRED